MWARRGCSRREHSACSRLSGPAASDASQRRLCLDFAAVDGSEDRRRVRADTPGGGLRVALALLATRTGAARQDVAAVGMAWGGAQAARHQRQPRLRRSRPQPRRHVASAEEPAEDSARVCPHAAAVQAAVALQPSALALLDPTQTVCGVAAGMGGRLAGVHRATLAGPACGGGGVAARGGRRLAAHARNSPRHRLAQRPRPAG